MEFLGCKLKKFHEIESNFEEIDDEVITPVDKSKKTKTEERILILYFNYIYYLKLNFMFIYFHYKKYLLLID